MKNFIRSRLFFVLSGFSGMFVIVTYLHNKYSDWFPVGVNILLYLIDWIQFPAFVVGGLIRGNPDAPNVVVYYVALFFTYMFIFGGLITLFRFIKRYLVTRDKGMS